MSLFENLKKYFAITSKERQNKDWKEVEPLNNIGPDVIEYNNKIFLEELKKDYASWLWRVLQFYSDKELIKLTKNPSSLLEDFPEDSYYNDYTWYDIDTYKEELLKLTKNILNDKLIEKGISL